MVLVLLLSILAANATDTYDDVSAVELLTRAEAAAEALEFERVPSLLEAALAKNELGLEKTLSAYLLQATALTIVGDPVLAERPFRMLLRADPSFDLPPKTPPRILTVFRKVQFEERTTRARMRELELLRLRETLKIEGDLPDGLQGGQPISIDFTVTDPRAVVSVTRFHYRKHRDGEFSALALKSTPHGHWVGELPGDWTASNEGLEIEYFVSTVRDDGTTLVSAGSATSPRSRTIAPGLPPGARPFHHSPVFWSIAAAVLAAAGTVGWIWYDRSRDFPTSDLGHVSLSR